MSAQRRSARDDYDVELLLMPLEGVVDSAAVIVKKTYSVVDGRLVPAPPEPLALEGPFDPVGSDLPFKRAIDVVVIGSAFGRGGRPFTEGRVRVAAGSVSKRLQVFGPRVAEWGDDGATSFGPPDPVESVPLTIEHAYGGTDRGIEEPKARDLGGALLSFALPLGAYPRNPCGRGFVVHGSSARSTPLPQVEDPDDLIAPHRLLCDEPGSWYRQPLPWITEWQRPGCFPRGWYAGVDLRTPLPEGVQPSEVARGFVPADWRRLRGGIATKIPFPDIFFQEASLGLVIAGLDLGAKVLVEGMNPEIQQLEFGVPEPPRITIAVAADNERVLARLINVVVKPDERAVSLTWAASRSTLPRRFIREIQREIPVSATVDGATVLPRLERPVFEVYAEARQRAEREGRQTFDIFSESHRTPVQYPRRERDQLATGEGPRLGRVDPLTGRVCISETDWLLVGQASLAFTRSYSSSMVWRRQSLGPGWSHCLDQEVWTEQQWILYRMPDGCEIGIPIGGAELPLGASVHHPTAGATIHRRSSDAYEVRLRDGRRFGFRTAGHLADGSPSRARLVRIWTADSIALDLHHDVQGRLERLALPSGHYVRFEHDATGRLVRVFQPTSDGRDWTLAARYEFDAAGVLREVADAAGRTVVYRYENELVVARRRSESIERFVYDEAGPAARVEAHRWGDEAQERAFYFDVATRLAGVTLRNGSALAVQCGDQYQAISITDWRGGKIQRSYDSMSGFLAAEESQDGESSWYYDADFHLADVTRPGQGSVGLEHDAEGHMLAWRDADGQTRRWSWDRGGRIMAGVDRAGASLVYDYDGEGPLVSVLAPRENRIVVERDKSGLVIALAGPGGRRSASVDSVARISEIADELGSLTRYRYHPCGSVVREELPTGSVRSFEVDPDGGLASLRDDASSVRFERDRWGRLVHVDGGPAAARLHRDPEGRVTLVEGEEMDFWELTRDGGGRVQKEAGVNGEEIFVTRDHAGSVKHEVRGDTRSIVARDAARRPAQLDHGGASLDTLSWTPGGKLTRAEHTDFVVELSYDGEGRPLVEKQNEHWVQSRYDAGGARVELASSLGLRMKIERDVHGGAKRIRAQFGERSSLELRLDRDPCGRETRRHLPGGIEVHWQRDAIGRALERSIVLGPSVLATLRFGWTGLDRLVRVEDPARGARAHVHDARGRLIRAGVCVRAMDEIGNVYRDESRADQRYAKGGRLDEAFGTIYRYDNAGRRIEKETPDGTRVRYKWDARDRLLEVITSDTSRIAYDYDALGRRVRRRVESRVTLEGIPEPVWQPDRETRYVWDGLTLLHEIEDGSITTWLWEAGALVGKLTMDAAYAVLTDPLGVPTEILDERGGLVWRAITDAFGLAALEAKDTACPWRFPGHYEDPDTGLQHTMFRVYDPETGSYLTQSPLGIAGGSNLYGYVSDPMSQASPLGLGHGYMSFFGEFPSERLAAELIEIAVCALDRRDGAAGPRGIFDRKAARLRLPDPEATLWGSWERYRPSRQLPPPTSMFTRLPAYLGLYPEDEE